MDVKSIPNYSASSAISLTRPVTVQQDATTVQTQPSEASVVASVTTNVDTSTNTQPFDTIVAPDKETGSASDGKKQLTKKDVENITDGLNEFMESMNTNIRFVLHTKLNELMVQVIDNKTQKVLREAPPKDLLDTIARIRDFVGSLLDKKA